MTIFNNRVKQTALFTATILTALITGSCTKEDLSNCGLVLKFRYDYNMDWTDKFPSDIFKLNVYVFDESGFFVGEFVDEGGHLNETYKMRLKLDPGRYNIYTWAELRDDYRITALSKGASQFGEARLSLIRGSDNTISTHPKPLYHGQVTALEVTGSSNKEVWVDLIKNTNTVKITAKGLPLGTGSPAFTCRIEGDNAEYKFDNSFAADGDVTYIPKSGVAAQSLVSDFTVMRLVPSGQSEIVLEYNPTRTGGNEIYRAKLIPLIMTNPGIDLDRQDVFEIEIEFDYTMTAVSITVNGWKTVLGSEIIG